MVTMKDIAPNWLEILKTVAIGLVIILTYAFVTAITDDPKAIRVNEIKVYSDGRVIYDREVLLPNELIFGAGEVRMEGARSAICRGKWDHTYKLADKNRAIRDIDWMTYSPTPCPLPLPVGAKVEFVYTPRNPDLGRTVWRGKVLPAIDGPLE